MIYRVASVYFDAYLGKTYGFLHWVFQTFMFAVIGGYSFCAAMILDPDYGHILPCDLAGQTYN